MKKPLIGEIERQIAREDESLYASRLWLFIAVKRFEKKISRSILKKK